MMPRSILTEKLARRGYHLSREYGVDPLETITVAEVMNTLEESCGQGISGAKMVDVFAYTDETCRAVAEEMATSGVLCMQVLDRESGRVCGTIGAAELLTGRKRAVRRESERRIAFQDAPEPDDSVEIDEYV
jgi:hypothetical protein